MPDSVIGRYEIRREIGRGAQSIVYAAWDPLLRREVAIKTLQCLSVDAEAALRLRNEARLAGPLRHPQMISILDAGEMDGDPYLVFELIQGRTLSRMLLREGPLDPERAVRMMGKVLDALDYLHALGIIHRDLKPANILVDERDEPRVTDLGHAVRIDGYCTDRETALVGTAAYLAPEYITRRQVSPQGDLYAAGLILGEMLSGQRQFQADSLDATCYRILSESLTPPPGIGGQLEKTLRTACAKEPRYRFADATEMRNALDGYPLATTRLAPRHQPVARLWTGFGAARGLMPRYSRVGM